MSYEVPKPRIERMDDAEFEATDDEDVPPLVDEATRHEADEDWLRWARKYRRE